MPAHSVRRSQLPRDRRGIGTAIAIGCVVVVLICGGILALVGYGLYSFLQNSVSNDPKVVAETQKEVYEIDVPDGFTPAAAVNMNVPFWNTWMVSMAIYRGTSDNEMLLCAEFNRETFEGQSPDDLREQMMTKANEEGEEVQIEITETEERMIEVRGEPVNFEFSRGVHKETDQEMWLVSGAWEGDRGMESLMINVDAERMDAEQIEAMIGTIK